MSISDRFFEMAIGGPGVSADWSADYSSAARCMMIPRRERLTSPGWLSGKEEGGIKAE